jgi:deoxyribodipyrimidine photo-lyase
VRTLVWFRGKELRLDDHAPLAEAVAANDAEIVCVFVVDPFFFAPARARELPHRMQFLLESIAALRAEIKRRGSRLFLVAGRSVEVVPALARKTRVDRVVAQRWTEPFGRVRDAKIAAALDVPLDLYEGETLAAPGSVLTQAGEPFSVFTPFARAFRQLVDVPLPKKRARARSRSLDKLPPPPRDVRIREVALPTLADLGITPNEQLLPGGEAAARARLTRFLRGPARRYDQERDRLDLPSTSRLSQDLKFGTLSPRTVWTAARSALKEDHPRAWASFENELLWREFTHAVLWSRPELLEHPHRRSSEAIRWSRSERAWEAWVSGTTGYPVVDAAARQLLGEGFVHNRARMIAASFLVKDLLLDFRRGEAHYLKYLTDGDWAQNDFGWQWSAGCGFDAQPFFRIFHPVTQGRRFDPTGAYVRRWVPELARLPDRFLHAPWTAPAGVLGSAGVDLGKTYPKPIVDHAWARGRFLVLMAGLPKKS